MTEVRKIDDLLAQEADKWRAHVVAANAYAAANQPVLDANHLAVAEFKAYAEALTQYIQPFAFAKKYSAAFTDDGKQAYYEGSEEQCANLTFSHIGTVDYWAAAIVDPTFMDLCQQRMRAVDAVKGRDSSYRSSLVAKFADFAPNTKMPEIKHRLDDGLRGVLIIIGNVDDTYYQGSFAQIGAYRRLTKTLKSRFDALMRDPKKAAAVDRVRSYFLAAYKAKSDTDQVGPQEKLTAILSADPSNQRPMDALNRLAHLKALGFNEIEVADGDTDAAVGRIIAQGKYANGLRAPAFEELYTRAGQGPSIDETLKKLNLPKLPAPIHAPYGDWAHYGDDGFDINRSPIPEKPKAFIRDFVAGAYKVAAAPQLAG